MTRQQSSLGGGLILAAGRGNRYGSDKRRAILEGSDRTMLERTLAVWQQATAGRLRVVLRGEEETGERAFAASLRQRFPHLAMTFATRCRNGMGASLAAGIRDCNDWDYVLIGLGDMPYLQPSTLRWLLAVLRREIKAVGPDCIVRPVYQGRPGHPVGFGRGHFAALSRLDGDVGARAIIETAPGVIDLPCADPGTQQDVDTPARRSADRS